MQVRLDRFLAAQVSELSRSQIQRLINQGMVIVNEAPTKPGHRLRPGDRIILHLPPPAPSQLIPEPVPLQIVYEDADLVVINKPPGMVVHPAPGHPAGTLVNALLAHCPDLAGIGGVERPGIVHRLDKDTSGLIVVAKNQSAHNNLTRQIKNRAIAKGYLALVYGQPDPPRGTINAPIARDPRHRQRMAVVPGGREAITHYQVLERLGSYSLLEVRPLTGRTHQIRVHLAFLGHPVVGDLVYGPKRQQTPGPGIKRQFLHAFLLGFRLPSSGEYREFRVDLAPDLEAFLQYLRQRAMAIAGLSQTPTSLQGEGSQEDAMRGANSPQEKG